MDITYSKRISLLYALYLAESNPHINTVLDEYDPLEAANYLACVISFQAIQAAGRSPADERIENFDMLSVYQAFAMLVFAYLTLPLTRDNIDPNLTESSVVIAKSLFSEITPEEWLDIIDSGSSKFQLIADAKAENWVEYREDLDKAIVAFIIAGTDEDAPYTKEDIAPLFGGLLSILCEAFASD